MTEKVELTDVQIALLIKNALDYNASVVQFASFIYGQDAKVNVKKSWLKQLKDMAQDYQDKTKEVLKIEEKK